MLELRAYDRYLDSVLERAYGDLTRFYGRGGLFRSARNVQEELSNARIDLVRVTDAINNIGKIFGDYYLAKLHLGLAERFHLYEWETIVREKMATLNDLYTLASHEVEHRRGVVLEGMIVLLFIVDLVLIFLVSGDDRPKGDGKDGCVRSARHARPWTECSTASAVPLGVCGCFCQ